MNNEIVEAMVLKDDLDMDLYKKPLGKVIEIYGGLALGELKKGNLKTSEDYLTRLLLVLRGNCKSL